MFNLYYIFENLLKYLMKVRDDTLDFTETFTKAKHYIRIKLYLAAVTKTIYMFCWRPTK